jgi:3'(2'), 5'-bisphosphate nucleotidase
MYKYYETALRAAIAAGDKIMEVYQGADFDITKKADQSPLTLADRAAHEVIVSHLKATGLPILSEEGRDIPYSERKYWRTFWLVDPLDGTKEFIKRNGEFTVNIALIEKKAPVFGVVYAPAIDELYFGNLDEGAWITYRPKGDFTMQQLKSDGHQLPMVPHVTTRYSNYIVVASRSHLNEETKAYIETLKQRRKHVKLKTRGSSLKLCMVAAGDADEYPRLGPTMEWDIAAAHAIVEGAERKVKVFGTRRPVRYNKEDLHNPYFIVK